MVLLVGVAAHAQVLKSLFHAQRLELQTRLVHRFEDESDYAAQVNTFKGLVQLREACLVRCKPFQFGWQRSDESAVNVLQPNLVVSRSRFFVGRRVAEAVLDKKPS
jgi:hypothetical protein